MEQETNRERFVRIAKARTQKIIDTIRLLGNCSNSYAYEYTQTIFQHYGAFLMDFSEADVIDY